jgi:hypothetical protein
MERSEKTTEIDAALLAAQGEFPIVEKRASNPFYNSRYAPYDGIVKAVRPILIKNNLVIEHSVEKIEYRDIEAQVVIKGEGNLSGTIQIITLPMVTVATRVTHTPTGEWKQVSMTIPSEKGNSHGVQALITYIKRNNLILLLDIAVGDEDDDGNSSVTPDSERHSSNVRRPSTPASSALPKPKEGSAPLQVPQQTRPTSRPVSFPKNPDGSPMNTTKLDKSIPQTTTGKTMEDILDLPKIEDSLPDPDINDIVGPPSDPRAAAMPAMTNTERGQLNLINSEQYDALKVAIKNKGLTPEKWKKWLMGEFGFASIQNITAGLYTEILATVNLHADVIMNYTGGVK